jgi:hypothetical protein
VAESELEIGHETMRTFEGFPEGETRLENSGNPAQLKPKKINQLFSL